MTSTVIKPTVGRKVWFRPNGTTDLQKPGTTERGRLNELHGQPLDATVTYVWSERMVNLSVLDHYGNPFIATSVNLLQPGDSTPATGFYAEWMPYQQGQAAKAEPASAAMASGIVIPPIGAPSAGTTSASLQLPVIDPGPDSLEREIQAKADKGPRVTPAVLKDEIASAHFFTGFDGAAGAAYNEASPDGVLRQFSFEAPPALSLLTFCVLVLRNGFTVVGHSACASPENYNKEIGERIARENAERQIWPLLGFRLRDELARPVLTDADAAADLAGTPRPI
ncbi:Gp49 family protein [Acidovorax sp. 22279]|uniref:Gp49 family protein n=1 Tax=Acidovorax sp. 22279 TaxID=3453900 RepID=UPI003F82B40C